MLPSLISGQSRNTFCSVLYNVACTLALSSSANTSRISVRTVSWIEGKLSCFAMAGRLSFDSGRFGGRVTRYWAVTEVEKILSATSAVVSHHQLAWDVEGRTG
jgi:hypothetical protein